ncbi:MAG: spondin domain-containing protein [Acidimicrobiales bacterium]
MKRFLFGLTVLLLVGAVAVPAAASRSDGGPQHWQVTVENLTPPGSQPLSPPLVVVHSSRADVWSVGSIANHGVAAIAEDANNAPLEEVLPQVRGVATVFTVPGGPIPSGESRSFEVETRGRFDRLTLLSMLVNTNDAFTGLDSRRVHGRGGVVETIAYDAGSERNNELAAFIPGPCCNNPFVRDPEGALIRPHDGITGVGDLDPAVYGWPEPAARITITRAP